MTGQHQYRRRVVWGFIVLIGVAATLTLARIALLNGGQRDSHPQAADASGQAPAAASEEAKQKGVFRTPAGEIAVHLEGPTQRLIGLQTEVLSSTTLRPQVPAYGILQEDPSHTFTIRAPIAGIVHPGKEGRWPDLGAVLPDGAVVGTITPRVAPTVLAAAKAARDRARTLNADDKIISDKMFQDAEARLASLTQPMPLVADRGGTVTNVWAQPDEAIENGQPVLRVARFDTILAKVVVPSDEPISDNASARVIVIGHEDHLLAGESIAIVAVDPKTQGQTILIRLRADGFALRPGQAITAYLSVPGEPTAGVVIPRDAIVRYVGKTWAYVQTARETFVQREVPTDQPVNSGWFVSTGFKPGERIVTVGAETVLSVELKAQIPSGEEGEAAEQQEQERREHRQ